MIFLLLFYFTISTLSLSSEDLISSLSKKVISNGAKLIELEDRVKKRELITLDSIFSELNSRDRLTVSLDIYSSFVGIKRDLFEGRSIFFKLIPNLLLLPDDESTYNDSDEQLVNLLFGLEMGNFVGNLTVGNFDLIKYYLDFNFKYLNISIFDNLSNEDSINLPLSSLFLGLHDTTLLDRALIISSSGKRSIIFWNLNSYFAVNVDSEDSSEIKYSDNQMLSLSLLLDASKYNVGLDLNYFGQNLLNGVKYDSSKLEDSSEHRGDLSFGLSLSGDSFTTEVEYISMLDDINYGAPDFIKMLPIFKMEKSSAILVSTEFNIKKLKITSGILELGDKFDCDFSGDLLFRDTDIRYYRRSSLFISGIIDENGIFSSSFYLSKIYDHDREEYHSYLSFKSKIKVSDFSLDTIFDLSDESMDSLSIFLNIYDTNISGVIKLGEGQSLSLASKASYTQFIDDNNGLRIDCCFTLKDDEKEHIIASLRYSRYNLEFSNFSDNILDIYIISSLDGNKDILSLKNWDIYGLLDIFNYDSLFGGVHLNISSAVKYGDKLIFAAAINCNYAFENNIDISLIVGNLEKSNEKLDELKDLYVERFKPVFEDRIKFKLEVNFKY